MTNKEFPTKILLIEDAEPDIILFRRAIRSLGYPADIKEVRDGMQALQELRNNSNYDLVVLDINLPRLSGFDVIQELKSEGKTIPNTVVLTSSDLEEDRMTAEKLGLKRYYQKPMSFSKFKDLVKEMIQNWQAKN